MDLPDFFGLDIGNHSIKLAQVKRNDQGATLLNLGSLQTNGSILDDSSETGLRKLADAIKKAREVVGINTSNCVAGMPESPIFSRLLTIPMVAEAQMQETVHWELKSLIPVPLSEVDVAFLPVAERKIENKQLIDVYVVAAPKVLTDNYKKVVDMAGLNLLALETESLANTRIVSFNYPAIDRDMMVFDFGANGTDLVLARDGVPVFAQSISTGSDALTKAIAADYGIDLVQAEKYKRTFGIDPTQGEGKIARAIEPIMQILINEMSRTLAYFREKIPDANATRIYMCGEAAKLPGLPAYIKQNLGVDTVITDTIQNIKIAGSAQQAIQQYSPVSFSVSLGLALKDA